MGADWLGEYKPDSTLKGKIMLGNEIPVEFPHFVRVACHSICEKVSIKVVIKPQAFGIWMQQPLLFTNCKSCLEIWGLFVESG